MSEIKQFLEKIKTLNSNANLSKDFEILIKNARNQVEELFPNLNKKETIMLKDLTIYLLKFITDRFLIGISEDKVIKQYTQNNYRDIKAIILMLIPFIDDKENNKKFKLIKELNQIIYNRLGETDIKNDLLDLDITDTLKSEFRISNFGIGLLNENSKDFLLKLRNEENTLIEEIIYHNFIGLLETIKICNGKLYINWINTIPISDVNFEEEEIYKNTLDDSKLQEFTANFINNPDYIKNFELTYKGLCKDDIYNVFRKGYYENIKKTKWLIFNTNNKYYLQKLNKILDLDNILVNIFNSYLDLKFDDKFKFDNNFEKFIISLKNNTDNFEVAKTLLIFFINNYKYKDEIITRNESELVIFKLFERNEEDLDEDYSGKDIEKINNISLSDVEKAFSIIDKQYIWDFLKETLDYFKTTIYSTFIIKDNKIDNNFFYIELKKKR